MQLFGAYTLQWNADPSMRFRVNETISLTHSYAPSNETVLIPSTRVVHFF